ncbi:MAG: hypothetical protein ABW250_02205 [Pyrinomonadaceae bacterium]
MKFDGQNRERLGVTTCGPHFVKGTTGPSQERTAGGTNISSQGGAADSGKAGGNTGGSGAQDHG